MQIKAAKLVSDRSGLSRRSAEKAILDRRVLINGTVPLVSNRFDSNSIITLDGKELKEEKQNVYVIFNKPVGYLVTKTDPFDRKTIWDLLPKEFREKLNSAGRLDKNSEGLLILTSDGSLIEKITHPRYEVRKKYIVEISNEVTAPDLKSLEKGVILEDGLAKAISAKKIDKNVLELVLTEGKKREVRRMIEFLGFKVLKLKRISVGKLTLNGLDEGKWRFLEKLEIDLIFE